MIKLIDRWSLSRAPRQTADRWRRWDAALILAVMANYLVVVHLLQR